MVVIRLARGGVKKRPFYHIVVTNSRNTRDGRFIERLGFYNPVAAGEEIRLQLNNERLDYWVSKGAQPSERVAHLIKNFAEIIAGKEPAPKKAKAKTEAPAAEPAIEEKVEAPVEKAAEPVVAATETKAEPEKAEPVKEEVEKTEPAPEPIKEEAVKEEAAAETPKPVTAEEPAAAETEKS
ncbi:MAG: 30S ribosomal protein S16 [Gammaproteobacteria bacterium]|nr:30S ribosomal protein S16 [Gammaproteobacteria bacterium]